MLGVAVPPVRGWRREKGGSAAGRDVGFFGVGGQPEVAGWWCGARCVWPVPGILGALVGAGVLMASVCPPFCPWSWCRRWVAACVRFVPLCVAVVAGVGALGAWWAWLGAGVRVDVYLVGSLCCLMVRGWCMLCVDGAGVRVWGWVLDVGASPARCGQT